MAGGDRNSSPVLLAAGGTGGHMFPAQAVAEALKSRGHGTVLITDARGMRYTDNFPADEIIKIPAANPNARGIRAKISAGLAITGGLIRSLQEVRRHNIQAAIGFGGYPSFPAMQAASVSKVRFGLHEQNSLLGRANRFLAPKAQFLAHGFASLAGVPPNLKTRQIDVGNPVRADVAALSETPFTPPGHHEKFRLLITGGSQGATLFSHIPAQAIAALPDDLRTRIEVTHQVRAEDQEAVTAIYEGAGVVSKLASFFDDLPALITRSHMIIARAGASTVTEIATLSRPSLLVPLAIAMDDHQTVNARTLVDANAALLLAEKDFTNDALGAMLGDVMRDPAKLTHMADNTRGLVRKDAANRIVDLIEEMLAP